MEQIEKRLASYRSKETKINPPEVLVDMWEETVIEYRVVKAKMETATSIRAEAEEFLSLRDQISKSEGWKIGLEKRLQSRRSNIKELEEKLANPTPGMLPPTVRENKVMIYPVR